MNLSEKLMKLHEFNEPEDMERIQSAQKNELRDIELMLPELKKAIDKIYSVDLSELKAKKSKNGMKYIATADYNGIKNGLTLVFWHNKHSGYMEFNVDIKTEDLGKKINKVFDAGNKAIDKITKKELYGRQFYHNPSLFK